MDFVDVFGVYDFLVRDSLILLLVGFSVYLMLNAGLFAVPQVGFMAVGAYTAAILSTDLGWPLAATCVAATGAGALCGIVLGAALARLDGVYLAIATIAFAEMARVTIRNLDISGGASGLVGVDRSLNDIHIVGVLAVVTAVLARLNRTRYGAALRAMREDPLMAAHQGVNVRAYRMALFTAAGALAGLAGAMRAHFTGFVEPSVFSFDLLVTLLTLTILGGMAAVAGSWVGAVVVFGLAELLRTFEDYRNIINAGLILLVIAFAPSGIVPLAASFGRRLIAAVRGRSAGPAPPTSAFPSNAGSRGDSVVTPLRAPIRLVRDRVDERAVDRDVVLDVRNLAKRFGGVHAVSGVSLSLRRGETFGLIGPNGSGKTTILNLLSGVYTPDAGTGSLNGSSLESLWGRPSRLTAAGIARTFQNIRLVDGQTVAENVRAGAYLRERSSLPSALTGMPTSRGEARRTTELVHEALRRVGIEQLAGDDVTGLPYGSKRKVEIARALVRGPSLLLLDEPTAGMAPEERDEIFELVESIRTEGTAVIVVEHDVAAITKHCDRAAVLNFGQVIAVGNATDVVAEEVVIDAYIGRLARA